MRKYKLSATLAIALVIIITGCTKDERFPANKMGMSHCAAIQTDVPLGAAANFTVLAGTAVNNDGASLITSDLGVSPGNAITGFQPSPINTIIGTGTVTAGLGIVTGTIYAGDPVADQARSDAVIAYNYIVAQVPDTTYMGTSQLDGLTFTPGVYSFAPSASLQANGTVYLDFQGDSNALFIFQLGNKLETMAGSKVIATNYNYQKYIGSNVYWAVGSSATFEGTRFVGTVIALKTISMASGLNVVGRMLALNEAVTMVADTISVYESNSKDSIPPPATCRDFVTGGGWIQVDCDVKGHKSCDRGKNNYATFGVSGGIKNGKFWGQLIFNDHCKNFKNCKDNIKIKSTCVQAYTVIDAVTRQIEGLAKVNGKGFFKYKVVVADHGKKGRNDSFSIELSNGYSASGNLKGGNIKLHKICGVKDKDDKEKYFDRDERDGHNNCDDDHD